MTYKIYGVNIMNTQRFAEIAAALGNTHRTRIIGYLACGEMYACELLEFFDFTQPTLSNHLKVLREAGIVHSRAQAKWTFYSLNLDLLAEWNTAAEKLFAGDSEGESYLVRAAQPMPEEAVAPSEASKRKRAKMNVEYTPQSQRPAAD